MTKMKESAIGSDPSIAKLREGGGNDGSAVSAEPVSQVALDIVERYNLEGPGGLDNANDLMLCILATLDRYRREDAEELDVLLASHRERSERETRLLEALSQLEPLAASTAVEFGRIDLALTRMERLEEQLAEAQDLLKTAAEKIHRTDSWSIALNFLSAVIYILLGAAIGVLAAHIAKH